MAKKKKLPENISTPQEKNTGGEAPAAEHLKSKRPLFPRLLFKLLRIIFLWLPLTVISLIIIALAAAKIFLTPERVESIIISSFSSMSSGSISLDVKEFSPYSGFAVEKIVIKNGPEFNNSTLLTIDRLAFQYSFFRIFTGSLRFPEIGIYKPRIYLEEKNGVWSAARLMKESDKKDEPKTAAEEEKEDDGEPSTEIKLPIAVDFLLNFMLEDLRVYVKGSQFKVSAEGLTFGTEIKIPPFKKVPLSVNALSLLEKMQVSLNPEGRMDVKFSSADASADAPLIFSMGLDFDKSEKDSVKFNSSFKFGTGGTKVRMQNKYLTPLKFMVSYDLFYDPFRDHLKLHHFSVAFNGRNWIYLTGDVDRVQSAQIVDISLTESAIPLEDLYPYFLTFTGDRRTRFSGLCSLAPLTIKGQANSGDNMKFDIDGNISLAGLYFKNPSAAADIPSINLKYRLALRGENADVFAGLYIPHLYYTLEGSRSGDNGLRFEADISASKIMSGPLSASINGLVFNFYNPVSGVNALDLRLKGGVKLADSTSGSINIYRIRLRPGELVPMVPGRFREQISAVPLEKPADLNMTASFSLGERYIDATVGLGVKVPDFNVNDLKLNAGINMDQQTQKVKIGRFSVESREWDALLRASGTVALADLDMDMKVSMKFDNKKMKMLYEPWQVAGLIGLNAFVKGNLETGRVYGDIRIENFFVKNDESMMAVNDLNMKFPYEYNFKSDYAGQSILSVNKAQVINNENFQERDNFTIESISIKHPARNEKLTVLKDFGSRMEFKNSIFQISRLKAYVLDGSLYGRDIMFYLADMNTENMEFSLILDVTNVDIGRLDSTDLSQKTRDAELSLSANFSGKGLDINRELSASGYINIYKVGEKFANRLMKGLNEEEGESKLGGVGQFVLDNFTSIGGFNFKLDKGLVYASIPMKPGVVLGRGARFENNEIKFDRMPIQEYLRNITGGDK